MGREGTGRYPSPPRVGQAYGLLHPEAKRWKGKNSEFTGKGWLHRLNHARTASIASTQPCRQEAERRAPRLHAFLLPDRV